MRIRHSLPIALLAPAALLAQPGPDARAAGMAGAYTALARGAASLGENPANLALGEGPVWSLVLPQAVMSGTVVGYGSADFRLLSHFSSLSAEQKAALLAKLPASGTGGAMEVSVPLAGLQIGAFAVGAAFRASGEHTLGRDLVDLALDGYDESRTDYQVGETGGRTAQWLDVAAGYGRRLPLPGGVAAGVTAHYYQGRTVARSRMFEPSFDVDARDVRVDYLAVQADGGRGWGLDVGLAAQPTERVTLSAAVTDVASRMTWAKDLAYRTLTLTKADFADVDAAALYDRFDASRAPLDPSAVPLEVYRTARGLYDGAHFPATLRAGASFRAFGRTELSTSYRRRLTGGELGERWSEAAAAGVETGLWIVGLRAGAATDLNGATEVSAGVSLGPIDLGVGQVRDGLVDGAHRDGYSATAGLHLEFGRRTFEHRGAEHNER